MFLSVCCTTYLGNELFNHVKEGDACEQKSYGATIRDKCEVEKKQCGKSYKIQGSILLCFLN